MGIMKASALKGFLRNPDGKPRNHSKTYKSLWQISLRGQTHIISSIMEIVCFPQLHLKTECQLGWFLITAVLIYSNDL